METNRSEFLVFGIVILITRLPFLFYGYGSEEDAWGLIVTARQIMQTGVYEVSRLPGHPLQEILLMPGHLLPAWALNMFTAVASTIGVVYFTKALKQLEIPTYLYGGIALAFTPVFYIQSTNVMDYTWALSFCLIAFYQLINRNYLIAGALIAIATGFRITSAAMLIPMLFVSYRLLGNSPAGREAVTLLLTAIAGSFIMFLPPLITYGASFFTFYQYFPYPELSRIFFKGTIGVWGIPGSFLILSALIVIATRMGTSWREHDDGKRTLVLFSLMVIILYLIAFIRIPQKSAFIIPTLPWLYLIFILCLNKNWLRTLGFGLFLSCFFLGMNLDHSLRGSNRSALSVRLGLSSAPVSFDLIYGPLVAEVQKRQNKMQYARLVAKEITQNSEKVLLIAGWYQNEIVYHTGSFESDDWKVIYYGEKSLLEEYQGKGYSIYFLPEQDAFNDLRYKGEFTAQLASPFSY